ncbi:hypothetical protein [Streptomyces sp. NPDC059063]|uniref:hypothetical protein n=1 Tax=unclassified Streptomyces TaxID=2593676 RepID=UPI003685624E
MPVSRAGAVCGGVFLAAALALTGCQRSGVGGAPPASGADDGPSSGADLRPAYGAVFLGAGECSSRGRETFTEVPCTSERAAARVVARYDGRDTGGPACPARTDFVLHISDDDVERGYACMRNLEPPHPGDPGEGGGPRTLVGDCVYGAGRGEVRETACDGSGRRRPEYRVVRAVAERAQCAAGTELYVALGGRLPVGCAVRV